MSYKKRIIHIQMSSTYKVRSYTLVSIILCNFHFFYILRVIASKPNCSFLLCCSEVAYRSHITEEHTGKESIMSVEDTPTLANDTC